MAAHRSAGKMPLQQSSLAGGSAGIDFGTHRLGVAIADLRCPVATPYTTYRRTTIDRDAAWLRDLVHDMGITRFVVGLPVHLSGQESRMSGEARRFAQWLGEVTSLPVALHDERFTTAEAGEHLAGAGLSRAKRKARLDRVAAQVLLASYLESHPDLSAAPAADHRQQPQPLDDSHHPEVP